MRQTYYSSSRGFSLIEVVIAMGLGLVVLSGALVLTSQAINLSDMVSQRSDMQQNGRVAINLMARDLSLAGTGFPAGGIQLPSGSGSQDSYFACDQSDCYITNNVYSDERLYAITPGDGKGPTINGVVTDVITLVYRDTTSEFDQYPLVDIQTGAANKIWFDLNTTPAHDHPVVGLTVGDILVLYNGNAPEGAVGEVTRLHDDHIHFDPGSKDPLRFNQIGAAFGNVKSILSPPAAPAFPPTSAYRINVITYYLDASDPNSTRLMRQVSGQPPVPVAENVEDLQITYDIYDENTAIATADLPGAGGTPNQIRKVNIALTTRSAVPTLVGRDFQYISLTTSIGPRNLTYRDRYE
ncbi:prepilin-type N-terminal cleavage/methylation domain-containing protein [Acidobacteria bacterium AH-259-L09]|nr:prepilin-type N-terminal cleavage/methylation domain-containing protein [Acidobacteria bacterium AH-259-L09]